MRRGRGHSGVGPRTRAAVSESVESPPVRSEQETVQEQVPAGTEALIAQAVAAGRAAEVDVIARAVAAGRAAETAERSTLPEESVSIERARRLGAQGFRGTTDPAEAEMWLKQTDRICSMMRCTEEQRLFISEFLLEDMALEWWTSFRERQVPVRQITWTDFQREFHLKYHSAAFREQQRREFEDLTQGGRSVAEYEAIFTRLSRYAPVLVADESERCRKFQKGLRFGIQSKTKMKMCTTYSELVEAAMVAEEVENSYQERRQDKQKKRAASSSRSGGGYQGKRQQTSHSVPQYMHPGGGGGSFIMPATYSVQESFTPPVVAREIPRPREQPVQSGSRLPHCRICGRAHSGVCKAKERSCYQCGQMGHFKRNCPSLGQMEQQRFQQ